MKACVRFACKSPSIPVFCPAFTASAERASTSSPSRPERAKTTAMHRRLGLRCPVCRCGCELGENRASVLQRDLPTACRSDRHVCNPCSESGADNALTLWCARCQAAFCNEHGPAHVVSLKHGVGPLTETSGGEAEGHACFVDTSPEVCSEHSLALRYMCLQCAQVLICGDCGFVGRHAGHKPIKLVKDVIRQQKQEITGKVERLERSCLPESQKGAEDVQQVTSQLSGQAKGVRAQIRAAGERARNTLEACIQQKLQEVDDIEQARCKVLDRQHDELKSHAESVKHATLFSKKLVDQQGQDVRVAGLLRAADHRLNALTEECVEGTPKEHSRIAFRTVSDHLLIETMSNFGTVLTCPVSAYHSVVVGETTKVARRGTTATFVVQARDDEGLDRHDGDDLVEARLLTRTPSSAAVPQPANISVEDKPNGLYEISYTPHDDGEHVLEVFINNEKLAAHLHVLCDGVLFDRAECQKNLTVSEDRRTIVHSGEVKADASVLGASGMRSGRHGWKVRVSCRTKGDIGREDHLVGVAPKQGLTRVEQNFVMSYSFSNMRNKWVNGLVFKNTSENYWQKGDVIQLVLDCDAHMLTMTNERSGETDVIHDLPDEELHPYFDLDRPGATIQLL